MRDEDECDPEFTNMSEQYVGDHVAGFGVERAGWLVADQQIGIAHQRSGDGHALLFASRQARRHAAHRPALEPDGVQHARGSSSDDPQGDASPVLQWECHVLPCAQMRYEGVVLEHEADMPAAEARPVGVVPRGAVPPVIGERSVIVVVEQPDDGGETGFAGS